MPAYSSLAKVLNASAMVDYHNKGFGNPTITLADMKCYLIEDACNALVGDFVYHYSSMLDAFTLCEVMEVLKEGPNLTLECVVIDSDTPSQLNDTRRHLVNVADGVGRIWAYEVYRPDMKDRELLESRGGFWDSELDFISMMAGQRDTKRRIRNRLFYVPPIVLAARVTSSWFKRVFGG